MADKTKKKLDNMRLWNAVCETDPKHTKKVNQRGGFTTIDAMYQIKCMTRQFGVVGVDWGFDFVLSYPPHNCVVATVKLWQGNREQYVKQCGKARLGSEDRPNEEAEKAAITDGLTKCASYYGFNADVFLGRFDDNKYVAEMREKFGEFEDASNAQQRKPKHKEVADAIKKKAQEPSTESVVPKTPVTDETFTELTKFIRGKADEVKKQGTTVRNRVILHLKQSLHKDIKFSLPDGVPLEEVQISDIRPQLDEDKVKQWILSEDIPF
tara:strand:- start:1522 stop:2322 length:801 start_codon:yes stop_codon:yes gene_type:complete